MTPATRGIFCRALHVALGFFVAPSLPAADRTATALGLLQPGQRLKVEGRFMPDGRLAAQKVEAAKPEDDLEIEGQVRQIDAQAGAITIGPWVFRVNGGTKFENEAKQPRKFSDLAKHKRVKVETRESDFSRTVVDSVRIYEHSGDTDIELTGPVEAVDASKAEIALPMARVRVDGATEYLNIAGLESARGLEETVVQRLIRRDDDEQHPDAIRIGRLYMGGRVGVDEEQSRDYDMDRRQPDSNHWVNPNLQVEIAAPLGEFSEAYTRLQFFRPTYLGNSPAERSNEDFNVKEAFLYVGNFLHRSLGLQIGRQRFRDRREWLYDDELDAVRLHFARSNLKLELAAGKGLFGPTSSRSDQYYFIAYSQYRLPGRRYLSGYAVKRNDLTPRDEDPIWLGLSSRGRVFGGLDYWAELTKLRGRRASNLIRGHGFDLGASYRLRLPLQPTVSGGYAFGSGDADPNDGVDGNFRQTSLQDNSFRYNGLKRYYYYGLVLNPELNNLRTATVDLGLRPSDKWSVNVNYHTYRQAVAARRLGDANIDIRPSGRDPRLGKEFDAVLVLRYIRYVDLSFNLGLFLPGPAFGATRNPAFLFRHEFRYYF